MPSLARFLVSTLFGCGFWTWLWKRIRQRAFARIADRNTGEQRRRACPPDLELSAAFMPGSFELDESGRKTELKNERGFLTLRNGQNIFYQTWVPVSGDVSGIVIFLHGFGDHCDFTTALKAKTICGLGSFAAATFDLPGHGRSDGLLGHVPEWLTLVDSAHEVIAEHLKPQLAQQFPGRKFFGMGESMGGGVLFSLLVREKQLLEGAILVCPMLYVSRDMFPPWIVVQIFKHLLVPLLPMWPMAPNKDISELCNVDPKLRIFMNDEGDHAKITVGRAKPRLQTAYELAFVSGVWMRSKIPEYDTPSLIIHGGGDVVTDHRVSEELFQSMKSKDKEFLYPDGVWHADLFHGGPTQYEGAKERFEAVLHWLKERC
eukprot:CAMPEP_0180595218 /NCGR_PEP_ID=MMETSP1037_2-20121125/21177_1 /TAXON_ID=632150 /ORGANISM="Azadinium spinosum, Strain 3D9" /LENGTH=373 /DNA_ID=CAMNT_0022613671 /DNA_START=32 /DNA_END=1153 /DNA_ORIENTATION=-